MHNKLVDALSPLGIDLAFIEYKGSSSEYIVFGIYNEQETDKYDDDNLSTTYYITLNYWYSDLSNIGKYKEIISLLKDNGYILDGIGPDLKNNGLYGKSIDFIYREYKDAI